MIRLGNLSYIKTYNFKNLLYKKFKIINMYKLKRVIQNNLTLIFITPIVINFLYNVIDNKLYENIKKSSVINLISIILGSILLFFVADIIKSSFKLDTYSISIVYFLISFFIFDSLFLPFTKNISFKDVFYIVILFWIILLLGKKNNFFKIFKIFIIFFSWRSFNSFFFLELNNLDDYLELNTDVPIQWYKNAEMIFNNNYYFGLGNNIIDGQGLLPSYIQSLLLQLGFTLDRFTFVPTSVNILWFISLLVIHDLKITTKNKFIFSITYTSLILNNMWLDYLLNNSLMIEGIVSLLISIFLINYNRETMSKNMSSYIFFLFFGAMCLAKNFVSILVMVMIVTSIFNTQLRKKAIVGSIVYSSNLIYREIYFSNSRGIAYTDEIDFLDLFLDFIFFRNIDLSKITDIVFQLFLDKPFIYLFLVFIFINLLNLMLKLDLEENQRLIFYFVLSNYILVNILYISYWRNVEFESSYRYIIETFHLIFYSVALQLSSFKKRYIFGNSIN